MDMKKLLVIFLLLIVTAIFFWWRSPHTVQGPSSDHGFEYITKISGHGSSSDILPMVIALHGNGDTPDNFFNTLLKRFDYPARFIVVRGPINYPGVSYKGRAWPSDIKGIEEYGNALNDAVTVLKEDFPTSGKPVVLGFSGGAFIAYYLAAAHPDRFSYIFPLSGRLSGAQMITGTTPLTEGAKVIAFHGTGDQLIAFDNGKSAVRTLQEMGVNAELVAIDGGHLGVFTSGNDLLLSHLSNALKEISP